MTNKNFDLTEDNGIALVGTAVGFLVISWICVALRTYTRACLMTGCQADDWLMLIGQVCFPTLAMDFPSLSWLIFF